MSEPQLVGGEELSGVLRIARAAMGVLACIETAAADRGPAVTQGSAMAQVCRVLMKTTQVRELRDALSAMREGHS